MKKAFQLVEFARYLLKSEHWRGHGVHSPFMYHFIRETLMKASKKPNASQYIAELRRIAPKSVTKSSFGASPSNQTESTHSLLQKISISPKYGKLLNAIVCNYAPKEVLELGSGLGVSSYYLANSNTNSHVVTVEGMKTYADIAQTTFRSLGITNVSVANSTFAEFFESLAPTPKFDLIFIDGAHTYEATISTFEHSLSVAAPEAFIVLDDIRWSEEMFRAWNQVKQHPQVRVSVDLGRIGIIFLNPILQKQEYQVRY
ncbi:class I SAM-dependent methyltransferase [uncultured Acetobacteroides sp.]|uniref:O-methyltransferase n=1 Tax=uncultured Acetobacteroides sp. TaxID=1760811 RepID=UPI0029F59C17|nr:class I SAM-dependent methyltransferase [uncultured Acetobacteroides sp.]